MVYEQQDFDTRPRINYKCGIAVSVETYCITNGCSLSISTYEISSNGFRESHFDENHGVFQCKVVVPRSRLAEIDKANPHMVSYLAILGADRSSVEEHFRERGLKAKHVDVAPQFP